MYVLVSVFRDALMIVDDFKAIVSELVTEDELPDAGPRIELMDAVIARLYSTSKQAIVSCCIVQHCNTTLYCVCMYVHVLVLHLKLSLTYVV